MISIGLQGYGLAGAEAARTAVMTATTLALVTLLAAGPTLADSPEYPPGLFENSPLRQHGEAPPSDPSDAPPPGAMAPDAGQPDALAPDDCADIAVRVFRSLAEVKAAHARCDRR
jgi:hypothetical protein